MKYMYSFFSLQDADAQVTFEDQQKINKFARTNNKLQDLKEEHEKKKVYINNHGSLII